MTPLCRPNGTHWLTARLPRDLSCMQQGGAVSKPLAIDLFTGLHGWAEGLIAEGWRVVGFDLEDMCGQFGKPRPDGVQLVLQDVLTLHGKQFRSADLIVASPPCQEFSYMAMPWSRAKEKQACILADPAEQKRLTALFDACFRIQREACEAAGRHIPMVVENVRGAQKWVGRSRWNFGSFHLWGDVPALMPMTKAIRGGGGTWFGDYAAGIKQGGDWFNASQPSISRRCSSKSNARKAASAQIAKIPFALSSHIARVYYPEAP